MKTNFNTAKTFSNIHRVEDILQLGKRKSYNQPINIEKFSSSIKFFLADASRKNDIDEKLRKPSQYLIGKIFFFLFCFEITRYS